LKKISREKIKFVIFLDTSDVNQQHLDKIREYAKILIVDHHIPKKYYGINYVNPRLKKSKIYIPTTCLAYSIYESNKKNMLWLAGVGILSDHGVRNCLHIFEELKRKNPDLIENVKSRNIVFDENVLFDNSMLGMLTKIIDSGRVVKGIDGAKFVIKTLLKTNNYEKLLYGSAKQTETILRWYCISKKEMENLINDFEKRKKKIGRVLFYEFKSKLKIKSSLAGTLSDKYKDKIIVISQLQRSNYKISMRRGKNLNVNLSKMIKTAISDIPGASGGGHPEAVGGTIPKKYMKFFLKNIA